MKRSGSIARCGGEHAPVVEAPRAPSSHGCSGWRGAGGRWQEASASLLRSEHPGGLPRLSTAGRGGNRPRWRKIGHEQAFGDGEVKGDEAALAGLNRVREYFGKVWWTGGSR